MNKIFFIVLLLVPGISVAEYPINVDIKPYSDKIEPNYNFSALSRNSGNSKYEKIVKFILSNSGDGTVLVDKLFVKIIDYKKYKIYTFPRGPLAPVAKYSYTVEINSTKTEFLITDQKFKYSAGEIDEFEVRVQAVEQGIYQFKIVTEGYDIRTKEKFVKETSIHSITFPEVVHYENIIKNARESVYVFLGGHSFQELMSSPKLMEYLYTSIKNEKIDFKAIVNIDYYFYRYNSLGPYSAQFLSGGYLLLPNRTLFLAGYNNVRPAVNDEFYDEYPYIIIDKKYVLTKVDNFILGKIAYIDGDRVLAYLDKFRKSWLDQPYLSLSEYAKNIAQMDSGEILVTSEALFSSNSISKSL
ncbi:hypothetical protein [Desulfosarcina ovata]|uniref:Gingipain domain-containing protein n=1 Tax=Desulfosarcina ovata subsp. ovata TaxID=2752305 RepID=A0A5K8A3W5_9BACT|nr:hypothetical protein [Desulfosarcina ovata]BBO87044.1 hypothetical protein DSCOOX_02240 [Desulfosarcina ovata subsp. ovata]